MTPDTKIKEIIGKGSHYTDTVKNICLELIEARAALKFYANDGAYDHDDKTYIPDIDVGSDIVQSGKRAHEFLKKWSEE